MLLLFLLLSYSDFASYNAKFISNYDGDTPTLEVKLGFDVLLLKSFRLVRVNTPEIRNRSKRKKAKAIRMRTFMHDRLSTAYAIKIHLAIKRDTKANNMQQATLKLEKGKYGRYVCELFYKINETSPWVNLNDEIIREGYPN